MTSKNQRQQIIIEIVKDLGICQISDIMKRLSEYKIHASDRTILRDLEEMISLDQISKKGAGKSTSYEVVQNNRIFEYIDVKDYFSIDYQQRKILQQFNFDIFQSLEKDIFTKDERQKLEKLQQQFIKNISKYDSQTLINKEYERIMIEFSRKSSAIEGNTYSLLNTEALIKENIRDDSKTPEETQMILNHKDAFNEAIQNKNNFLVLRGGDIEFIHTTLTKKLGIARNIRKKGVGVTGTSYRPLDNEFQIKEALEKMIQLISHKDTSFDKAFIALLFISYIQPFEDGNKRTARMLANAILLSNFSIPLSYRIVDIVEYKKATILFYEINNITYFKKIFIDQFEDAVNHYFI